MVDIPANTGWFISWKIQKISFLMDDLWVPLF